MAICLLFNNFCIPDVARARLSLALFEVNFFLSARVDDVRLFFPHDLNTSLFTEKLLSFFSQYFLFVCFIEVVGKLFVKSETARATRIKK